MEWDIQEKLATRYYKKFSSEMDEYMYLAMTEACHPLIDNVEKIVCMYYGVSWDEYLAGDTVDEDNIRNEAHTITTQIMKRLLQLYARAW